MEKNLKLNELITAVPTAMLIEDAQMLFNLAQNIQEMTIEDIKEDINCVLDCLSEAIDSFSDPLPDGTKPSMSSLIDMECGCGVFSHPNGEDLTCAGTIYNVSDVMSGGVPQCDPRLCKHGCSHACNPEAGKILLENGLEYNFGCLTSRLGHPSNDNQAMNALKDFLHKAVI